MRKEASVTLFNHPFQLRFICIKVGRFLKNDPWPKIRGVKCNFVRFVIKIRNAYTWYYWHDSSDGTLDRIEGLEMASSFFASAQISNAHFAESRTISMIQHLSNSIYKRLRNKNCNKTRCKQNKWIQNITWPSGLFSVRTFFSVRAPFKHFRQIFCARTTPALFLSIQVRAPHPHLAALLNVKITII